MLFNSYVFLVFGVFVFTTYFIVRDWTTRKLFLLVMSYIFYAAWNAPYLLLILFSTGLDYVAARRMATTSKRQVRNAWLVLSLIGNLGVLSYFKYGGFLLDNFVWLASTVGIDYQPMPWSILLPVGISFYTFQSLSYSIDVYRGNMEPSRSFLDFALFVTFFPQLVAGPIVRAIDFMPQLVKAPKVTLDRFGWGLTLALFGLFQKVAIADGIAAPVVNQVFAQEGILPLSTVALGCIAFSVQILCDFSGYSLVAIGLAACLGFHLPENFRAPYAACGYQDVWRRWHVSMSGWFRDYLYGPLRAIGNKTLANTLRAQAITLVLIGLWHGASWTFVLWGAYNALVVCTEISLKKSIGHWSIWSHRYLIPFYMLLTYVLFSSSAVLFRAESLSQAGSMYASLFHGPETAFYLSKIDIGLILVSITVIISVHAYIRNRSFEGVVRAIPFPIRTLMLTGMILAIALIGKTNEAFIYFQF